MKQSKNSAHTTYIGTDVVKDLPNTKMYVNTTANINVELYIYFTNYV